MQLAYLGRSANPDVAGLGVDEQVGGAESP